MLDHVQDADGNWVMPEALAEHGSTGTGTGNGNRDNYGGGEHGGHNPPPPTPPPPTPMAAAAQAAGRKQPCMDGTDYCDPSECTEPQR